MAFRSRINSDIRARVSSLRHIQGLSVRKIADLCNVSPSSVLRICREKFGKEKCPKTPSNRTTRGRPKKLNSRQERHLLRCLVALRSEQGNFNAKQVMEKAGLSIADVSVRTVTRFLNKEGYFYLQARKKGLLRKDDLKKRLAFVRHCRKSYTSENFWTEH